jgi:hypothetical protein
MAEISDRRHRFPPVIIQHGRGCCDRVKSSSGTDEADLPVIPPYARFYSGSCATRAMTAYHPSL